MRILTRYILKEVSSHALLGVLLFTFVIFMRDLGRLLELVVRNSAPLPSVAEIFFYTLPTTFTITLPMGVLVGILIGLSRLAADSEVTAIRASGMGAGMFVRVVAIFAVAAWVLGMINSIYLAPNSAAALSDLQDRLKSSQASFEIQPRVFYEEFKNNVLYVQDAIPSKGQSLWRGVFLADVSDPCVSQNHPGRTRRPAQRIPRKSTLPSRGRHPAGVGAESERPVLDHDLREHRHSHRVAFRGRPWPSRLASGDRIEPSWPAAERTARTRRRCLTSRRSILPLRPTIT